MNWDQARWERLEQKVSREMIRARSDAGSWAVLVRAARSVLRNYSSSFFLVTRFLPPAKRAEVEVIYASVRYPDEVVDTFPLTPEEKLARLRQWEESYRFAMRGTSAAEQIRAGVPWILTGFSRVAQNRGIPFEHYLSFLAAMRRDIDAAPFASLRALIGEYVYGSAIVVGYFLTHIYGWSGASARNEALECARELGIALQLTNFARDVQEDHLRGRLYLPRDLLAAEGLTPVDCFEPDNEARMLRAIRRLAGEAARGYQVARRLLPAFAPDCRTAISACIETYEALNRRILTQNGPLERRLSVGAVEKFRILPASKYWRLPLAYAGVL